MKISKKELKRYKSALGVCMRALDFYADPGTYFAIGFFPDRHSGAFINDFSKTEFGQKPGKLARKTYEKLLKKYGDLKII